MYKNCMLKSSIFQLQNKWYLKVDIVNYKNEIAAIDNECCVYAQSIGLSYRSCLYEDSILIKIPYRYNKFEAKCVNSTFYELKENMFVDIEIIPIGISNIYENQYTCCFKLTSIKLCFSQKHLHAPLDCAKDEEEQ